MITNSERNTILDILSHAPEPEQTFTCDEISGFLFGLAITPDIILPNEWLPIIFGGVFPHFEQLEQLEDLSDTLITIYNRFTTAFHHNKLSFPFDIETLDEDQLATVFEWTSGLEEALSLREDIWDPEEYPELSDKRKEELFYSMMAIQGMVDPLEVCDFFEELPDEVFEETFPGMDSMNVSREAQIQIFLMASLPLNIKTLQKHAATVEKKRQRKSRKLNSPIPIRSAKTGRNEPCPCNSGKKYKKCCGNVTRKDTHSSRPTKKSNIIQGNFPKHKKEGAQQSTLFQLKVALHGAKPPIWRRILVPDSTTLAQLHHIIQISMGWTDSHLHQFTIDKVVYSPKCDDEQMFSHSTKDEAQFTLQQLDKKLSPRFQYLYDYGDNWLHTITVEKTLVPDVGQAYPKVLTGRRSSPPEDIGGIPGYMDALASLQDPEDPNFIELLEWLGDDFDPARFGKQEIIQTNKILAKYFSMA